ncbi:MAG: hypothetical protein IT437_08575 [Phycisphaerales bacterium]|nr:hypothetical protein [Phycisphaerales bacterium]
MDPKIVPVIHGVLVPGGVAAVLTAACLRPWSSAQPYTARLAGGLAVAGAVVTTIVLAIGWPGWLPPQADRYALHITAFGAILGIARRWWVKPMALRAVVCILASAAAAYLLTRYKWNAAWSGREGAVWLAGMGLSVGLAWLVLEMLADRARGAWLPLMLWTTAAGLGLSLALGANEVAKAELAAAVASACAVLVICGWWRPAWPLSASMIAPAALVCGALVFSTAPKGSDPLPMLSASLLVLAAPAGGLVRELLARGRVPGWLATLLALAVAAGLSAWAVTVAAAEFVPFE